MPKKKKSTGTSEPNYSGLIKFLSLFHSTLYIDGTDEFLVYLSGLLSFITIKAVMHPGFSISKFRQAPSSDEKKRRFFTTPINSIQNF